MASMAREKNLFVGGREVRMTWHPLREGVSDPICIHIGKETPPDVLRRIKRVYNLIECRDCGDLAISVRSPAGDEDPADLWTAGDFEAVCSEVQRMLV